MPRTGDENLCAHFGTCGGCSLQDLAPEEYRARLKSKVVDALSRAGLDGIAVDDVKAVAPGTRRRAVFKLKKQGGSVAIGFHGASSHTIVDMHECLVLVPALVDLVQKLRAAMTAVLHDGEAAEFHVTMAENGFDALVRWQRKVTPSLVTEFARLATALGFVRITSGRDTLFARGEPLVHFGNAEVKLPPGAFLQPTREGEAMLRNEVLEIVSGAKRVADLFSGCGTFALPLAENARVHAFELDRAMASALEAAARATSGLKPVSVTHRDLFKRPLSPAELEAFDAVVLDPPRAGAEAQARALAASRLRRVAYVSCDSQSFARDAKILVDAGFRPRRVLPVDQFLWSGHIELVAAFERSRP